MHIAHGKYNFACKVQTISWTMDFEAFWSDWAFCRDVNALEIYAVIQYSILNELSTVNARLQWLFFSTHSSWKFPPKSTQLEWWYGNVTSMHGKFRRRHLHFQNHTHDRAPNLMTVFTWAVFLTEPVSWGVILVLGWSIASPAENSEVSNATLDLCKVVGVFWKTGWWISAGSGLKHGRSWSVVTLDMDSRSVHP